MATQDTYTPWVTERTNLYQNPGQESTTIVNVTRTNLATNPNFETDNSGWTPENSAVITRDTTSPISGSASGNLLGGDVYKIVPAVAGDYITFSVDYKSGGTLTGTAPKLFVGQAGGTVIPSVSVPLPLTQIAPGRFSATIGPLGVGATGVIAAVFGAANGGTIWFDNALIEKTSAVLPYFDGSTAASGDFTYVWTGTANLSTSTQKALGVTGSSPTGCSISSATNELHSGTRSTRVMTWGTVSAEGWLGTSTLGSAHSTAPVSAGVWVKGPAGALLYLVVRLIGAAVVDSKTNFTCTGSWQFVSVTHPMDAAGTTVQIHVRTQSLQVVTFYVDDITVEEAPSIIDTGFSGDTTDPYPLGQYIWSGTPHASTSLYQDRTIAIPGDYIPVLNVATKDVLYGSRITSYRWEVLKHSVTTGQDTLVGTLDGVSDGSLSWTQNAAVKGGGKIQVADLAVAKAGMLRVSDLSLESVRVRPVCVVQGLPENPLGVFLVSAATEQWEATGRVWGMELLDRCTVPSQDAVDSSYAVAAGTLVLNQVKTILTSSNEYLAVDASNTITTQSNMVWQAGTSKLKIINDLLDVANYNALWVDGYGNFQTTPRVLPADRPINYELLGFPKELIDGETSIYKPDWTRDRDSFDVPNKVIAIQSAGGSDASALIGTWTNTDPASPYSTVTRGRTIPYVLDSVDCPAGTDPQVIAFLQSRARTTLIQMSATQATIKVNNLPIPVRVGDVLRFANVPAGVDDKHTITRIQLDTTSLGLMQSTLQEVISL